MLQFCKVRTLCFAGLICLAAACNPSDRQPGLWLSGSSAAYPDDWAFTDAHPEIAVEVATPYFVAHSVTVWCAQVDGTLYLGARSPEEKNWPGWVDDDPNVRLLVSDGVYEATLVDVAAADEIATLEQAYATKYDIESMQQPGATIRYWRVAPRPT